MLAGIDISQFQKQPNFDTLKKNISFVILKASEGFGYEDPEFKRNQAEARRVGFLLGYYHFARPDLNNAPETEADYFLSVVGKLQNGEMLCLDFEVTYKNYDPVVWCLAFLDRIFEVTKVRPLIYLNQNLIQTLNWQPVVDGDYGLWVASYDGKPDGLNFKTEWPTVAMKQYTNNAALPGVDGAVDGNSFFGEETVFKAYGYKETTTPPSPTPVPTPPGNPSDADKQAGIKLFDLYRPERKTPNGAEGNYESYARAVIGSDKDIPGLKGDLTKANNQVGILQSQAEISAAAFTSVKNQLEIAQNKLDDLAENPPTIPITFRNPVAQFFLKLAQIAEH